MQGGNDLSFDIVDFGDGLVEESTPTTSETIGSHYLPLMLVLPGQVDTTNTLSAFLDLISYLHTLGLLFI